MIKLKFLEDLKRYSTENNIPNISLKNAKFLRDLIFVSKAKNILEIGMANGFSAINFALALRGGFGKITSIEFSKKSFDQAIKNFEKSGLSSKINPIFGDAINEIPKLKNKSFDFIFIDATKSKSKDFLELSLCKAKKQAIIIIDDVIKFSHKMSSLWDFLNKKDIDYNIIPVDGDDGILMIIKK